MRLLFLLLALVSALSAAAPAKRAPNLVFILTDNQGAWTLGCYGNPDIRTPHLDRLAAGRTSDLLVSNYDFMPTVLAQLGLGAQLPAAPRSPGRDFSAALYGPAPAWDNVVFYEMETTRAIRTDDWKYIARFPNGPHELYDLKRDPRERFNLFGQPGQEPRRAELARQLDEFFARHADPQYDLWKGGRSKAKRHVE